MLWYGMVGMVGTEPGEGCNYDSSLTMTSTAPPQQHNDAFGIFWQQENGSLGLGYCHLVCLWSAALTVCYDGMSLLW